MNAGTSLATLRAALKSCYPRRVRRVLRLARIRTRTRAAVILRVPSLPVRNPAANLRMTFRPRSPTFLRRVLRPLITIRIRIPAANPLPASLTREGNSFMPLTTARTPIRIRAAVNPRVPNLPVRIRAASLRMTSRRRSPTFHRRRVLRPPMKIRIRTRPLPAANFFRAARSRIQAARFRLRAVTAWCFTRLRITTKRAWSI